MSAQPVVTANPQENYPNIIQFTGQGIEVAEIEKRELPEKFDFTIITDPGLQVLAENLAKNDFVAETENPYLKDISNMLSAWVRGDEETIATKDELITMLNSLTNLSQEDIELIEKYKSLLGTKEVELVRKYERAVVDQTRFEANLIDKASYDKSLDSYYEEERVIKNEEVIASIKEVLNNLDDQELADALLELLNESSLESHEFSLIDSVLKYLSNTSTLEGIEQARVSIMGLRASLVGNYNDKLSKLIDILSERVESTEGKAKAA